MVRGRTTHQGQKHGLPPGALDAMLARQGGRCLLCGGPIDRRTARIDHSHRLARLHGHSEEYGCPLCLRGLLDSKCNALLGFAQDSPALLRRAAAYIELADPPR